MHVTLQRKEIAEAVQGFGKIITGKTSLPILGGVKFYAEEQKVTAQVTDLDHQTLEYRFDNVEINGLGSCVIPFTKLKELAKGSKSEKVDISLEGISEVSIVNHIGGHAVPQTVAGMDVDDWPSFTGVVTSTAPAGGFLSTYRRLLPFSSSDDTRQALNSVFVEVGKGKHPVTMISTDGRRLCCINHLNFPFKQSIVIPVTKFMAWTKISDSVEIGVSEEKDKQTLFGVKAGPFKYTTKTIDAVYPNFRQVIPSDTGDHVITFTDNDVELLKQVLPTFSSNEGITIVGCDGKITLYGTDNPQSLILNETVYSGERIFVGLDYNYLLDSFNAGFRSFEGFDETSPLLARDGNGGTHVQMPMRVDDPEGTDQQLNAEAVEVEDPVKEEKVQKPVKIKSVVKPVMPVIKPKEKEEHNMKEEMKTTEPTALDRVLDACNIARDKVREANTALGEVTIAVRAAVRDHRAEAKEMKAARTALGKLQAISL